MGNGALPNGLSYRAPILDSTISIGSVAAAWPLALRAQEAGRAYRIGGMSASPLSQPYWVAVPSTSFAGLVTLKAKTS